MWLFSSFHPNAALKQLLVHFLFTPRPENSVPNLKSCDILPNLNLVATLMDGWQRARHSEESCREERVCSKRQTFLLRNIFFFFCQESWEQIVALHLSSWIEKAKSRKGGKKGTSRGYSYDGCYSFSWESKKNQFEMKASSKELLIMTISPWCSKWNSS